MGAAMTGLCGCGCGRPTTIATRSRAAVQHVKGQFRPFLKGHHISRPVRDRFFDKVSKLPDAPGCWLWTGKVNRSGYGRMRANGCLAALAHRVSYELAYGPFDRQLHVLHRCDTPACVRPDHLFLGTNADNRADSVAKSRHAYGARQGHAKLSIAQVHEIRRRVAAGELHLTIASDYGVARSQIGCIVNGVTWGRI